MTVPSLAVSSARLVSTIVGCGNSAPTKKKSTLQVRYSRNGEMYRTRFPARYSHVSSPGRVTSRRKVLKSFPSQCRNSSASSWRNSRNVGSESISACPHSGQYVSWMFVPQLRHGLAAARDCGGVKPPAPGPRSAIVRRSAMRRSSPVTPTRSLPVAWSSHRRRRG